MRNDYITFLNGNVYTNFIKPNTYVSETFPVTRVSKPPSKWRIWYGFKLFYTDGIHGRIGSKRRCSFFEGGGGESADDKKQAQITFSKNTHLTLVYQCRVLLTFAISLDLVQDSQNAGPDLDSNCLTLWWYSKRFRKKIWFWKKSTDDMKN